MIAARGSRGGRIPLEILLFALLFAQQGFSIIVAALIYTSPNVNLSKVDWIKLPSSFWSFFSVAAALLGGVSVTGKLSEFMLAFYVAEAIGISGCLWECLLLAATTESRARLIGRVVQLQFQGSIAAMSLLSATCGLAAMVVASFVSQSFPKPKKVSKRKRLERSVPLSTLPRREPVPPPTSENEPHSNQHHSEDSEVSETPAVSPPAPATRASPTMENKSAPEFKEGLSVENRSPESVHERLRELSAEIMAIGAAVSETSNRELSSSRGPMITTQSPTENLNVSAQRDSPPPQKKSNRHTPKPKDSPPPEHGHPSTKKETVRDKAGRRESPQENGEGRWRDGVDKNGETHMSKRDKERHTIQDTQRQIIEENHRDFPDEYFPPSAGRTTPTNRAYSSSKKGNKMPDKYSDEIPPRNIFSGFAVVPDGVSEDGRTIISERSFAAHPVPMMDLHLQYQTRTDASPSVLSRFEIDSDTDVDDDFPKQPRSSEKSSPVSKIPNGLVVASPNSPPLAIHTSTPTTAGELKKRLTQTPENARLPHYLPDESLPSTQSPRRSNPDADSTVSHDLLEPHHGDVHRGSPQGQIASDFSAVRRLHNPSSSRSTSPVSAVENSRRKLREEGIGFSVVTSGSGDSSSLHLNVWPESNPMKISSPPPRPVNPFGFSMPATSLPFSHKIEIEFENPKTEIENSPSPRRPQTETEPPTVSSPETQRPKTAEDSATKIEDLLQIRARYLSNQTPTKTRLDDLLNISGPVSESQSRQTSSAGIEIATSPPPTSSIRNPFLGTPSPLYSRQNSSGDVFGRSAALVSRTDEALEKMASSTSSNQGSVATEESIHEKFQKRLSYLDIATENMILKSTRRKAEFEKVVFV